MHSYLRMNSRIHLFAILFIAIGIYGIFKPTNFPVKGERESLAEIISITNVLRIKEAGNIAWTVVDTLRTLNDGDYVFTSDDSRARVRYYAGVDIELAPNTLLEIRKREDDLDLKINFGRIKVSVKNTERKISVRSKNEKIEIKSKNSGVNIFELNEVLRVDVLKGDALVSNQKKTVTLSKNESIELKADVLEKKETASLKVYPDVEIKKIFNVIESPEQLEPENLESENKVAEEVKVEFFGEKVAYRNGKFIVNFNIANSGNSKKLLLSAKSDFSSLLSEVEVLPNQDDLETITLEIDDIGKYYWKVGLKKGSFTIGMPSPPQVPKVPSIQDLDEINTNEEIYRFTWEEVTSAESYEIEIFSGRDISNVFKRYNSKNNYFDWKHDAVDSYLFRVRAIDRWGQKSDFSNTGKLVSPISPFSIDSNK